MYIYIYIYIYISIYICISHLNRNKAHINIGKRQKVMYIHSSNYKPAKSNYLINARNIYLFFILNI